MDAVADNLLEQRHLEQADERRVRLRWILMGAGALVALILGVWYYLATGRYVSTDDSAVMAAQATISSNVPGRVVGYWNDPVSVETAANKLFAIGLVMGQRATLSSRKINSPHDGSRAETQFTSP